VWERAGREDVHDSTLLSRITSSLFSDNTSMRGTPFAETLNQWSVSPDTLAHSKLAFCKASANFSDDLLMSMASSIRNAPKVEDYNTTQSRATGDSGLQGQIAKMNVSPGRYQTRAIQGTLVELDQHSNTAPYTPGSLNYNPSHDNGLSQPWTEQSADGLLTSTPSSMTSATTPESVWYQSYHEETYATLPASVWHHSPEEATENIVVTYQSLPSRGAPRNSAKPVYNPSPTIQSLQEEFPNYWTSQEQLPSPFAAPLDPATPTALRLAFAEGLQYPTDCYKCPDGNESFPNYSLWLVHVFTKHVEWKPACCLWNDPPCNKPAIKFKNLRLWLDHVKNVHQKSFFCDEPGCKMRKGMPQEKPFGTLKGVERHKQNKHQVPIYCRKPYCSGRKTSKLNRPDKKEIHNSKWHGHLSCNESGCLRRRIEGENYGFASDELLIQHQQDDHHRITGVRYDSFEASENDRYPPRQEEMRYSRTIYSTQDVNSTAGAYN
jgi:hypothetical protein